MADLMSKTTSMGISLILSYLSNIDFVSLSTTSRYFRSLQEPEIGNRRKASLVRFTSEHEDERMFNHEYFSRGTKLPNGSVEGKIEVLDGKSYGVCDYVNGEQVGALVVYNYCWCEGKRIPEWDRRLFAPDDGKLVSEAVVRRMSEKGIRVRKWEPRPPIDSMVRKFRDWEEMDVSKMQLMNIISADGELRDRYIYGYNFRVPSTGEFVVTIYPSVMFKTLYRSRRRYFDGALTDIWVRCKIHEGKEHHILVTRTRKMIKAWNSDQPSKLITHIISCEDSAYDICDEKGLIYR